MKARSMFSEANRPVFGVAAALALAVALGFGAGPYGLSILINLATYVALATAWVLFSGPTRLASLATAAFFGIGVYSTAILTDILPTPLILLSAATIAATLALAVGLATLRLSGVYFVIFSFSLAEFVRQVVIWEEATIAGTVGRYVFGGASQQIIYWQLLAIIASVFSIGFLIERSRLGWAIRALGEDEAAARHIGINATLTRLTFFVLSATLMALVGAVIAPRWTYIDPNIAFNPMISFQVLIMAMFGGTSRLWGPAAGVIVLVLLFEEMQARFPTVFPILLGLVFLVGVFVLRDGLVGLAGSIGRRKGVAKDVA